MAGDSKSRRNVVSHRHKRRHRRSRLMFAPLSLEGKVAIVMGGTSGIGRAISLGLADAGADVISCSRRMDAVEAIAQEIEGRGRRSLRIAADVANRASLAAARDVLLAEFGRVDILINCAG